MRLDPFEVAVVLLTIMVGSVGYYAYRANIELNSSRLSNYYTSQQAKSYEQKYKAAESQMSTMVQVPLGSTYGSTKYIPLLPSDSIFEEGQNLDLEQQNQGLQDQLNNCQDSGC
jgi:hypothetical protein